MSGCCSLRGLLAPNAVSRRPKAPLCIASHRRPHLLLLQNLVKITEKADGFFGKKKALVAAQLGAVLATFEHPALAITGVNYESEFTRDLLDVGVLTVWYFLVMPPIIMNWLRLRWYRRKFLEMYFQFMFVFLFFPALLLWAPFLNFRKFPRDPSLKYPWEKPKDPSKVKNAFLKYPFAGPDDYA